MTGGGNVQRKVTTTVKKYPQGTLRQLEEKAQKEVPGHETLGRQETKMLRKKKTGEEGQNTHLNKKKTHRLKVADRKHIESILNYKRYGGRGNLRIQDMNPVQEIWQSN